MKNLFFTWLIILGMVGIAFAQTEKTFVKTFATAENIPFAIFTVNGPATIYGWDEETIRITVKVKAPEVENEILDKLFKTGRYEWQMRVHKEAKLMIFEMPKQEEFIFINGFELMEELEYEILVPRGIRYRILDHKVPVLM